MRLYLIALLLTISTMPLANSTENTLIDFSAQDTELHWQIVNDGVMGGLSSSQLEHQDNIGLFTGSISLENNGGFASVQFNVEPAQKSETQRVRIKVKGDGKRYQLRFKANNAWDRVAYAVSFETIANNWIELDFDVEEFVATFRGRTVQQAPRLNLDQVYQAAFMIADKQAGNFEFEIVYISVF